MSSPTVGEAFTAFYHGWLVKQDAIFHRLESFSASPDGLDQCSGLVAMVMAHYMEYYQERNKAAEEDFFVFFASPWMSSFEQSFLWLAGFKPSMLFSVAASSSVALTEEQRCRVGMLKAETCRAEKVIAKAVASVQETVAAPPMLGALKRAAAPLDVEAGAVDEVMENLVLPMRRVMGNADALRGETALKILEILTPEQSVRFLTAVMKCQRDVRRWGVYVDSQRASTSAST